MSLLLKRLQEPDIHTYIIGKVKEYFNIIVISLSHNTTVEAGELLPFVYMSVSTFVSRGKPIDSNKHEEESDDSEIEENFHIKISNKDKIQSATNKESNKANINTSYVFQWNTSTLNASKDICMAHEEFFKKRKYRERLLTVPMHEKWLASHGTSLLNIIILMGWRTLHLPVLSIFPKHAPLNCLDFSDYASYFEGQSDNKDIFILFLFAALL